MTSNQLLSVDQLRERIAITMNRCEAATEGPWWSDENEMMWRLHGVRFRVPAHPPLPEQIMNHQILKAPKYGTPYAEYWPNDADAEFIIEARTDLPIFTDALGAILGICAAWAVPPPPELGLDARVSAAFQSAAAMILTAVASAFGIDP